MFILCIELSLITIPSTIPYRDAAQRQRDCKKRERTHIARRLQSHRVHFVVVVVVQSSCRLHQRPSKCSQFFFSSCPHVAILVRRNLISCAHHFTSCYKSSRRPVISHSSPKAAVSTKNVHPKVELIVIVIIATILLQASVI